MIIESSEYIRCQNLLYQCQYRRLVETAMLEKVQEAYVEAVHLIFRAAAFYELHQIDKVQETITNLQKIRSSDVEEIKLEKLYLLGRMAFFHDRFSDAEAHFLQLLHVSDKDYYRAKALLGLANSYLWQEKYAFVLPVLNELNKMNLNKNKEIELSLYIFQGNYELAVNNKSDDAGVFFQKAWAGSAKSAWTYFMQRSLHGLTRVAQIEGNYSEMNTYIGLLRGLVDAGECVYMSYIVNRDFSADRVPVRLPVTFDDSDLRIRIRKSWVSFHERPLIYQFIRLLSYSEHFVTKEEIAAKRWPNETYSPLVHDARVYDLARRVRASIEAFEEQPVLLLSGRSGYRLAHVEN